MQIANTENMATHTKACVCVHTCMGRSRRIHTYGTHSFLQLWFLDRVSEQLPHCHTFPSSCIWGNRGSYFRISTIQTCMSLGSGGRCRLDGTRERVEMPPDATLSDLCDGSKISTKSANDLIMAWRDSTTDDLQTTTPTNKLNSNDAAKATQRRTRGELKICFISVFSTRSTYTRTCEWMYESIEDSIQYVCAPIGHWRQPTLLFAYVCGV